MTQALNGAGSVAGNAADLNGIFAGLTDPNPPAAGVATFDTFVDTFASGIDGLWAGRMNEVSIVCGPDTYKVAAKSFRDGTDDRGGVAFSDYAMERFGAFWTNKRMPATDSHIQARDLLPRRARNDGRDGGGCGPPFARTGIRNQRRRYILVAPHRGSGFSRCTSCLGDVILVQPDAYSSRCRFPGLDMILAITETPGEPGNAARAPRWRHPAQLPGGLVAGDCRTWGLRPCGTFARRTRRIRRRTLDSGAARARNGRR